MHLFSKKNHFSHLFLLLFLAAPMLVQGAQKINIDTEMPWRELFLKDCEKRYRQEDLENDPDFQALSLKAQGEVRAELFQENHEAIIHDYLLKQLREKLIFIAIFTPLVISAAIFNEELSKLFKKFQELLPGKIKKFFSRYFIPFFRMIAPALATTFLAFALLQLRRFILIHRLYNHLEDFFSTKLELELLFMQAYPYLPEATKNYVVEKLKEVWLEPLNKWDNLQLITTLLKTTPNLSDAPQRLVYDKEKVNAFLQKYRPELREELKNLIFKIIQTYNNPHERLMIYIYGVPGTGKSHLEKEIFAFLGIERGLINLEAHTDNFFGTAQVASPLTLECARVMQETNIFACSFPDGDRFLNAKDDYVGMVLKLFDSKELTYIDAFYNLELKLPRIVFVPGNSKEIKIAALASRFAYKIDFNRPYTLRGKKDILVKYFLRLVAEKESAPFHLTDCFLTDEVDSRIQELAEDEDVTIRKAVQLVHKLFISELREQHTNKVARPPADGQAA